MYTCIIHIYVHIYEHLYHKNLVLFRTRDKLLLRFLQTLIQEVNLGKKIPQKTKRHEKVFVEQGTLLVFG